MLKILTNTGKKGGSGNFFEAEKISESGRIL
jgi:hypothetical protein